jgi:uncharacterized membrane protein YuzA (DUF378 family)
MKIHTITFILLIIGGLNWLLIGVFNWGVEEILGATISRIIYIIVGLSALYEVFTHKTNCKHCEPQMGSSTQPSAM